MTQHHVVCATKFLHPVTAEDIENERTTLEAMHGMRLEVFSVEHKTRRNGVQVTYVEWEEIG